MKAYFEKCLIQFLLSLCPSLCFYRTHFYRLADPIRGALRPHRPGTADSHTQQEGLGRLSVPGGGARLHADTSEGDLGGH